MLTLFILKSGDPKADSNALLKSFNHMAPDIVFAGSIKVISDFPDMRTKWYIVMYDNEKLDQNLMEALPVYLEHSKSDVVVMFKIDENDEVTTAPRLFRKDVILRENCLLPRDKSLKFDRALDGWIDVACGI